MYRWHIFMLLTTFKSQSGQLPHGQNVKQALPTMTPETELGAQSTLENIHQWSSLGLTED